MRRVLLTGASGFIGRYAVAPLVAAGFDVVAVGRTAPCLDGATCLSCNLLDPTATDALVARIRPTHLLHLAWDVTHGAFWTSRTNLDWAAATLHLYRSVVAAGCRQVTVAGTCAEYDWSLPLLDEDAPCRPATLYGVVKDSLHRMLRAAARADQINLAWGRIFLLYGPHESPNRLVASLTRKLLAGEPAPVGNGEAKRDILHVADVAGALAALTDRDYDGAINIACGHTVPLEQIATLLGDLTGRADLLEIGRRAPQPNDPAELAASGERLRQIGFSPRFGLREGLADTVAWWAAQPR